MVRFAYTVLGAMASAGYMLPAMKQWVDPSADLSAAGPHTDPPCDWKDRYRSKLVCRAWRDTSINTMYPLGGDRRILR
eukprot:3683371-Amphidinium_carterae.3